ncbi:MAG: hypothetical protein KDA80_00955, partial [Planctomycetaceae bacterium]|nr:hypothetical protein [Planctomycetaceae bacterium]
MTSLRILVLTPVLLALMCGGHWGTVSSVLAQEPTKDSAEPQSATVPPSADPSPPSAEERGLQEEEEQEAEKKAPPPPPPWVLQPYVVEVILNFETNSRLPLTTQQRLVQEVQGQLQRRFRQMWQATIRFGEGATSFSRAEVEVLDNDTGLAHFGESAADKVFVVSVNAEPGWFALICREWDSALQLMGPALRDRVMDRRGLGDAIADSICDAFRPIAELEVLEEGKMEFLIRAGEYPPLDPEQTLFRPGDYLMPVMRYLNRSREVRSIQPIP